MSAVVAPTFKLIKGATIPAFEHFARVAQMTEGVHYAINRSDFYIDFLTLGYRVWLISADNYKNLVAYQFDCIWVDEPGYLRDEIEEHIGQRAGRSCRCGQVLWTGVVQSPNWYYNRYGPRAALNSQLPYRLPRYVEEIAPDWYERELVRFREGQTSLVLHASSFENPTLSRNYFLRQIELYGWKEQLFAAQVIGLATPVNSKLVYDEFAEENLAEVKPRPELKHLNLSFDFNVGQMAWVAAQEYSGEIGVCHANRCDALHTVKACDQIKAAFPKNVWGSHAVSVYGDPAGWARSTQTGWKDGNYAIIRRELQPHFENLTIRASRETILQEARVINTNKHFALKLLSIDKGLLTLIGSLQSTAWDPKGGIKKGSGDTVTHMGEALDFLIYGLRPPVSSKATGYHA